MLRIYLLKCYMQQTSEQHIVSAVVDAETRAELERRAAEIDRSISWLIRQAVDDYLRGHNERSST